MRRVETASIRTSPAGKMNNQGTDRGFTFVEMVVVVSILSILFLFSVPLFRDLNLLSAPQPEVSGLAGLIESLKQKAVARNTDVFLHIEPLTGRVWTSDAAMDETALDLAKEKGIVFDRDVAIVGVEVFGRQNASSAPVRLCFYKRGYSDRALVHLRDDGEDVTLQISPFLPDVERHYRYVSYDDCI